MNPCVAFLCLIVPVALQAADDDCRFRADRSAEASTDGIRQIVVKAGPGSLQIRGEVGRRSIQANGVACASRENQLERLQIRVDREGDKLLVSTDIPEASMDPTSWFGTYSRLDLSIKVPVGIALDIDDSSGEAEVSNVGSLRITDSSGPLHVENVKGSLEVADGSGEMTIARVQGPVRINDGSGSVTVEDITGEVTVVEDGSGSMTIADVQGSVTIGNDGSGEIRIEGVTGSVKIENDGSGGIRVARVKHDVSIDHDGSGGIDVEDVDGDLSVGEAGSGGIHHERVSGSIRLENGASEDRDEDQDEDVADEKVEKE